MPSYPGIVWFVTVFSILQGSLLAAYLLIAMQRALFKKWDRGSLGWARTAMLTAATGEALSSGDKRRLAVLSPPVLARLLNEFAGVFAGPQSENLRILAEDIGLSEHLRRRCKSRLWWRRLEAVRTFSLLNTGSEAVLPLLDDSNDVVRYNAIEWASGSRSEVIARHLVDSLVAGDRFCRYALEDSLARMGQIAATLIRERLKELWDDEQAIVAMLEVGVVIAGPGCEEIAERFSSHPSSRVRELCADLFVRLGGADATTTLVVMLDDDSHEVRKASARALGRLEHWPAAARLAGLLDEARWPVRAEAALSLAKFGAPGILFLRREVEQGRSGAAVAKMALDTLAIEPGNAVAA